MKEQRLMLAILLGVVAGSVFGWAAGEAASSVAWIGDLFLNALKMLVLPLVFCSMVAAVSGLAGSGGLRRMALFTFGYYLLTTLAAVVVGLLLVNLIEPGVGIALGQGAVAPALAPTGIAAIATSIITPNVVEAAARFQILPVLVFALALGAALAAVGEQAREAISFFHGCNQALLKLVDWVMYLAPLGIAALIAARIGAAGGGDAFVTELQAVGYYCLTVITGLALHAVITLPLLLRVGAGRSPLRYARNLGEALVTAFGTASSSATLALTMRLTEERNQVRAQTANFVLPLGATVNMDGTALYEAVAALFIAQAAGIELGFWCPGAGCADGDAGFGGRGRYSPRPGLVTMVIVLEAVGLPLEGISLILAVDWFLDRCRTSVNVWGDATAAAVVDARVAGKLHP